MQNLIFLFSLPRSGSTLLQKILMAHPAISSVTEPWILLPYIYASKTEAVHTANYDTHVAGVAINDLIKQLPEGKLTYNKALKTFITTLYENLSENSAQYFFDKTPRYFLIIPEIIELFPDAKFIFLFRHPLGILASFLTTWYGNNLRIKQDQIDLYQGPELLANGYQLIKEKAIHLQYEDLIHNPEKKLKDIANFLSLDINSTMINSLINSFPESILKGRHGDPKSDHYKKIQKDSLFKWKNTFNSPLRKKYALEYLDSLSDDILFTFGYNKIDIIKELSELPEEFSFQRWIFDKYFSLKSKYLNK